MAIIIAFFCGMCFLTLADSIADYIEAKADQIEAQAEKLKLDNEEKKKGENHGHCNKR